MRRGLTIVVLLTAGAVGALFLPAVRNGVLPPLANWLDIDETPECTTYVMVLPGDEIRRALTAAALVRIGLAHDVLIPQNPESADIRDGITLPTAQISRKVLLHRGISPDRVVLLSSESRSTFDDAQALSEFLRGRKVPVTVVTSAFHTRRARFVFRKVLGDSADQLRFVSAPNPGFTDERWWESREGVRLILTEYVKLGYYSARYADKTVWVACILLVVAVAGWHLHSRRRESKTAV